ncbi:DUF4440 domain-containing protein [Streptomyces sp. NPDC052052]|uniref:DUF4440 domain-containing protein n=1 Tax=Streptomyces sp. NPDC052052 TaxID=3154756 RepID=UPI00343A7C62
MELQGKGPLGYPCNQESFGQLATYKQDVCHAFRRHSGPVIDRAGTLTIVRDMGAILRVLGEERANYSDRVRCYCRTMSKTEIDALTAELFDAFDNRGGKAADVARICRLVLPSGVIVKTRPDFTVYTVDEFIEPRQRLLTDGRLVEFSEWEVSERTEIAGEIASRFCEYRKSGILDGEPFEGGGAKAIQFVHTSDGWRIAAFSWYDQP